MHSQRSHPTHLKNPCWKKSPGQVAVIPRDEGQCVISVVGIKKCTASSISKEIKKKSWERLFLSNMIRTGLLSSRLFSIATEKKDIFWRHRVSRWVEKFRLVMQ